MRNDIAMPDIQPRGTVEENGDVYLYGEIGEGGWAVDANDMVPKLRTLSETDLTVYINSPGGDIDHGLSIYTALAEHQGKDNHHKDD